jgi:hypothetical protein
MFQRAIVELLRYKIHFQCRNKASWFQKIKQMDDVLKLSVSNCYRCCVETSFRNIFNNQKAIYIRKFSKFNDQEA